MKLGAPKVTWTEYGKDFGCVHIKFGRYTGFTVAHGTPQQCREHCEHIRVSMRLAKRYWTEAKKRSVKR